MEAFGIALWLLGGLLAAPTFCFALVKLVRPIRAISLIAFWVAAMGVALFGLELILVRLWGVLGAREHLGLDTCRLAQPKLVNLVWGEIGNSCARADVVFVAALAPR